MTDIEALKRAEDDAIYTDFGGERCLHCWALRGSHTDKCAVPKLRSAIEARVRAGFAPVLDALTGEATAFYDNGQIDVRVPTETWVTFMRAIRALLAAENGASE